MNPLLVLIPAFFLFLLGALFSYRQDLRSSAWFLPVYLMSSVVCALLWVWACKALDDQRRIYFLSLCWDLLMVVCYYVLPLILCEFRVDRMAVVGVGLMLLGLAIVKMNGG